ncbi:flagellar assembly protein FliH [Leadbettera azotonutricia]|uniref:Flagellar assembly protein FliH n=1 Tax=Leadbettera azotonutricia (strain ATCC BAA-888 / DSM 13862 / ZAS-9) TaxID=545695 RepID=F5Y8Z4_LEAAZ|nr:flagellar assembly protein FliH [Leadbettera azotonutricia]AEF80963.1 flagellar assembly protein [Leadbettera azotonutricia ZAS-9]
MAKAVYRPGELELLDKKIILDPPTSFPELAHLAPVEEDLEEIPEEIDEYSGPTADDLRREAEAFKEQWESEKEAMVRSARVEADRIIKEAEEAAFKEVKRKTDEAQSLKRQAQDEADKIVAEANEKARQIETDSRAAFEAERKEAEERGREAGRETGFSEGKAEVERLVQRTQTVLERAQDKRAEILAESEQEIIDLVLLITRKVVKVITENQRNVIISNVVQALRKVKGRGNIIIKVNMADVKLSTDHIKDFIAMVEGAKSIQVVEDSTVDQGGCIIETDFGEIDARISSQLAELETKILEISPIKAKAKTQAINEGA